MTTYIWKIIAMRAYPESEGQTDVVFQVDWQCTASEPTSVVGELPYRAQSNGSVSVTYQSGDPFTPYDDLTETQVWGWVDPQIDRTATEADLQVLINQIKQPGEVSPPLPWVS